jgi:transcriptional regulator GlxA family with amidase domain
MVVPPHRPGGQSQFIEAPIADSNDDDTLGPLLVWMLEHLDDDLTLESLARRVHMSPRTLSCRFVAVTGASPHRWLLDQRILLAQRLLEATSAPVERVAQQAGFGSGANFRQHFSRLVGTSPQSYRRTFRVH